MSDRPRPGVCTFGGGHLAPAVWQYGDDRVARAICDQHKAKAIAASLNTAAYEQRRTCPNWTGKANPKHEHGGGCLI